VNQVFKCPIFIALLSLFGLFGFASEGCADPRSNFGAKFETVTPELARERHLPLGVLITEVIEGGAAANANVAVDDVLQSINGRPVIRAEDAHSALDWLAPGTDVRLTLLRSVQFVEVRATLLAAPVGERPQTMLDWIKWLLFDWGDLSPAQRDWIGFLISMACVYGAYRFARAVQSNARLFTVMALFAGALVAIASAYQARILLPRGDELATVSNRALDVGYFLMTFAGALLARESKIEHRFLNSESLQIAGLFLLFLVVIPRGFPPGLIPPEWEAPRVFELVMSMALNLLAYLALAWGAKAVATPRQLTGLGIILLVYAAFDATRDLQIILYPRPRTPISEFFMITFALGKISLTFMFGYIVWDHRKPIPASPGGEPPNSAIPVKA